MVTQGEGERAHGDTVINIQDANGLTALMMAVESRQESLVLDLLAARASVSLRSGKDQNGASALEMAIKGDEGSVA